MDIYEGILTSLNTNEVDFDEAFHCSRIYFLLSAAVAGPRTAIHLEQEQQRQSRI